MAYQCWSVSVTVDTFPYIWGLMVRFYLMWAFQSAANTQLLLYFGPFLHWGPMQTNTDAGEKSTKCGLCQDCSKWSKSFNSKWMKAAVSFDLSGSNFRILHNGEKPQQCVLESTLSLVLGPSSAGVAPDGGLGPPLPPPLWWVPPWQHSPRTRAQPHHQSKGGSWSKRTQFWGQQSSDVLDHKSVVIHKTWEGTGQECVGYAVIDYFSLEEIVWQWFPIHSVNFSEFFLDESFKGCRL